jgi:hypothetical protein
LSGAFCIIALLAIFKLRLASPNYLAQNTGTTLLRDVTDPSRYLSILVGFVYEAISFGGNHLNPLVPLFAALFLLKGKEKRGTRSAAIILSGMCAGFFFVYLITPVDLSWQIAWSLDRLLLQLWPAALFTCGYIVGFPATPPTSSVYSAGAVAAIMGTGITFVPAPTAQQPRGAAVSTPE